LHFSDFQYVFFYNRKKFIVGCMKVKKGGKSTK
jgi:hypothetical protein